MIHFKWMISMKSFHQRLPLDSWPSLGFTDSPGYSIFSNCSLSDCSSHDFSWQDMSSSAGNLLILGKNVYTLKLIREVTRLLNQLQGTLVIVGLQKKTKVNMSRQRSRQILLLANERKEPVRWRSMQCPGAGGPVDSADTLLNPLMDILLDTKCVFLAPVRPPLTEQVHKKISQLQETNESKIGISKTKLFRFNSPTMVCRKNVTRNLIADPNG